MNSRRFIASPRPLDCAQLGFQLKPSKHSRVGQAHHPPPVTAITATRVAGSSFMGSWGGIRKSRGSPGGEAERSIDVGLRGGGPRGRRFPSLATLIDVIPVSGVFCEGVSPKIVRGTGPSFSMRKNGVGNWGRELPSNVLRGCLTEKSLVKNRRTLSHEEICL